MTTALDETLSLLGTFRNNLQKRSYNQTHRKPLKLPRPCFPMARQCVKLRRTNPAHAEGNLFRSEPELGVLSRSPVHMESVSAILARILLATLCLLTRLS